MLKVSDDFTYACLSGGSGRTESQPHRGTLAQKVSWAPFLEKWRGRRGQWLWRGAEGSLPEGLLQLLLNDVFNGFIQIHPVLIFLVCISDDQVSSSTVHQEFFVFLQRLLSPVLEAYSGAAIFVHSLTQPTSESDYTQRLFRYLLTRTERGVAAYGKTVIIPYIPTVTK